MSIALRAPAHRISPRAIVLWLVHEIIGIVIFVALAMLISTWIDGSGWSWVPTWIYDNIRWLPLLVAGIMTPLAFIETFWRYAVHRWEFSDDVVYARSGWFSREWVFVPVSRVQTVDKTQGWLERALGLATLEIRTASYAGSSSIKGLDYAVAATLAEQIAQRAQQLRDDAT
ncbi:PH domain-containing protein [Thermopolyspora sp. NPDC052614]|uniref:PH domain-containing protein n=1 Tax=Thermopolyspora sp. NPDC052614 TaxID=3155682 RepID=UPI003441133A